jgi:hypothetical protein
MKPDFDTAPDHAQISAMTGEIENVPSPHTSAGVFITRGITVSIPKGGFTLTVDEQGKVNTNVLIHVHYDVCPTWLYLAARHLSDANERRRFYA